MFERPEYILGDIIKAFMPSADFLKPPNRGRASHSTTAVRPRARTVRGESWYRDKLACELNGQTAVPVPGGYIDVLTSTEIVEVHTASQWKQALGQIQQLGHFYPAHRMRIHLFGKLPIELSQVELHCQSRQVVVTWIA